MTTSVPTSSFYRFQYRDEAGDERDDVFKDATPGNVTKHLWTVTAPSSWSVNAVRIVHDKYLLPEDDGSILNLITRVTSRIAHVGMIHGYFGESEEADFQRDLEEIVVNQLATWNSPVWFNVGNPSQMAKEDEQAWACLILGVDDYMQPKDGPESIESGWLVEAETFRKGSGSGVNVSRLRAKGEPLSGGVGVGTGPISLWMKPTDAIAGVVSSGGRTRRAAKMVIMDVDHPEVMEFIDLKARENRKAKDLKALGYDISMNGRDSESLLYQNANNSVRVTDAFMNAVKTGGIWELKPRLDETRTERPMPVRQIPAREVWDAICQAAAESADPGIQFHDTINRWNTVMNDGEITSSNPCSEYMFLDNTVCNLASINIWNFVDFETRSFRTGEFSRVAQVMIRSMDILCDLTSHVSPYIREKALEYRTLGLGIANLGATLMALGLPYNSDEGRTFAAAVMSLLQASAYHQSAMLASMYGAYPAYDRNSEFQLQVIDQHATASEALSSEEEVTRRILIAADRMWIIAAAAARDHGVRNAQVSVNAPAGTISFMLDAETTGIEPVFSISAIKDLVGGGSLAIDAQECVRLGLEWNLKYGDMSYGNRDVELHPLFATAIGVNALPPEAHVDMICALQPFTSGAISKTINLPAGSTAEDVSRAYMRGWEGGAKALAVYVDESKPFQPLNDKVEVVTTTSNTSEDGVVYIRSDDLYDKLAQSENEPPQDKPGLEKLLRVWGERKRLPGTHSNLVRHKFTIAGSHEFYLVAGFYEDGTLAEIFFEGLKEGSAFGGMVKSWAIAVSMALQTGCSFEELKAKFRHQTYEPSGFVQSDTASESNVRSCTSVADYVFNWLDWYMSQRRPMVTTPFFSASGDNVMPEWVAMFEPVAGASSTATVDGPGKPCPECTKLTLMQTGTCWQCRSCGYSDGGCG